MIADHDYRCKSAHFWVLRQSNCTIKTSANDVLRLGQPCEEITPLSLRFGVRQCDGAMLHCD